MHAWFPISPLPKSQNQCSYNEPDCRCKVVLGQVPARYRNPDSPGSLERLESDAGTAFVNDPREISNFP
jgi:hypothetical protein